MSGRKIEVASIDGFAIDGPQALKVLLASDNIDLKAVVGSKEGESSAKDTLIRTARMYKQAHRPLPLLGIGTENAPIAKYKFPGPLSPVLGGILAINGLPRESDLAMSHGQPLVNTATDALIETIESASDKITLLMTIMLPELLAVLSRPDLLAKIENAIVMAGNIKGKGNARDFFRSASPDAETNSVIDPVTLLALMKLVPITLFSLDATRNLVVTRQMVKNIKRQARSESAKFVVRNLALMVNLMRLAGIPYTPWDAITAEGVATPNLARYVDMNLTVVTDPTNPEYGRTIPEANGPSVRVAMQTDEKMFESSFSQKMAS